MPRPFCLLSLPPLPPLPPPLPPPRCPPRAPRPPRGPARLPACPFDILEGCEIFSLSAARAIFPWKLARVCQKSRCSSSGHQLSAKESFRGDNDGLPDILCHSTSTPPYNIFASWRLAISASVMRVESVLARLPLCEPGGHARNGFSTPFLVIWIYTVHTLSNGGVRPMVAHLKILPIGVRTSTNELDHRVLFKRDLVLVCNLPGLAIALQLRAVIFDLKVLTYDQLRQPLQNDFTHLWLHRLRWSLPLVIIPLPLL